MCQKNQRKGEASMEGGQHSVDTLGSPWQDALPPLPRPQDHLATLRDRNPSSPLSSLALRTSSDTRRTELRRAARSPLGTSKRTKYSRWGLPASGLWAGRVSKWWILASNVFRRKKKQGAGGGERQMGREPWREMKKEGER